MPTGYARDGTSLGNNSGLRAWRKSRSESPLSAKNPKLCRECGDPVTTARVNSTKPKYGGKYYVRLCDRHLMEHDRRRNESRKKRKYGVGSPPDGTPCAICNLMAEVVDHDHSTGLFRSYLCHKCNRGIGFLNDDVALVERAAEYLRGHLEKT